MATKRSVIEFVISACADCHDSSDGSKAPQCTSRPPPELSTDIILQILERALDDEYLEFAEWNAPPGRYIRYSVQTILLARALPSFLRHIKTMITIHQKDMQMLHDSHWGDDLQHMSTCRNWIWDISDARFYMNSKREALTAGCEGCELMLWWDRRCIDEKLNLLRALQANLSRVESRANKGHITAEGVVAKK